MKKEEMHNPHKLSLFTIILFFLYLFTIASFFFFLDLQQQTGFGILEIILSILFAFIFATLFAWVKALEHKNPYFGFIIGIVILSLTTYGLIMRYWGPYTTVFLLIGIIITLVYMIFHLIKYRRQESVK